MMAETRIPSRSSICVQYQWRLSFSRDSLVLSTVIGISGVLANAFRLGAGIDGNNRLDRLRCYITGKELLARLGVRVTAVTCTMEGTGPGRMQMRELRPVFGVGDKSVSCFLFASDGPSANAWPDPEISNTCLTFRLYLSGSVEQFIPYRFDALLGHQLWDAAVTEQRTDVIFQVRNRIFAAHKFVLAARSAAFRAMFDDDICEDTIEVQVVDVDPTIFEQFLHFLYTGQLCSPAPYEQLGMVAKMYQVETLISICQAAFYSQVAFQANQIGGVTAERWRSQYSRTIKQSMKEDPCYPFVLPEAALLFSKTYVVEHDEKSESEDTQRILDTDFFYDVKLERRADDGHGTMSSKVTFYCNRTNNDELAWEIAGVDLLICKKRTVCWKVTMSPSPSHQDDDERQIFVAVFDTNLHDLCADFHFVVHRVSTVRNFQYRLRDSLFAQQLWSSAVSKKRTDVEFELDDGKIFPAHRALLAARCPHLAALIPADSTSTLVRITTTMESSVFEDLLYFAYTGLLKTPVVSKEFSLAAESFQVATLRLVAPMDIDGLIAYPDQLVIPQSSNCSFL